jgi:tetratricopeptide repeat protein 21B
MQEHNESAIYHFQQLLDRRPDHFAALAELVGLLRHAGRLEDVPK